MRIKKLSNNIFQLIGKDQYELTSTFVRLQEYYESPFPKIRGHYFQLPEFIDEYTKWKGVTEFTYYSDWFGFNVPGNVVNEFYETFLRHPCGLTEKEWGMFELIKRHHNMCDDDYYIIGTFKGSSYAKNAVKHEVAHAMYYLDEDYKNACEELLNNLSDKRAFETYLKKKGYFKEMFKDEMQAYLSTDGRHLKKRMITENAKPFEKNYKKYVKKNRIKI